MLFLLVAVYCHSLSAQKNYKADVIIYGGTSAAITAAVQVKRMNHSVIIVSPDKHLGGLSSGGLGFTDSGDKTVIGGLSKNFYERLYRHYQKTEAWKWEKKEDFGNKGQGTVALDSQTGSMWLFEPSVAEAVFKDFIRENEITVHRDQWLLRKPEGLKKEKGKIKSFQTLSGNTYKGKIFIDATYEGDLMALAGVSYTVGREANSLYDEKWNGVQKDVKHHRHYFKTQVDPYVVPGDATSGLLPEISGQPPGENGEGDDRIQAYCFRLCMSNHPENRVPFPKPQNYNPSRYELMKRVFETGWNELFEKFDMLPNRKTDTNNHGPFSSDYIGKNYDYPEASYERRADIIEDHKQYQMGLLYFLQNDPSVPQLMHDQIQEWGLAKDEFIDTENWPSQLYIREARRMVSDFVMTEGHTLSERPVIRPIGMGSYSLDSHNAQRYVTEEGFVQNEGDIGVHPKKPYSIDYGSIIPKAEESQNLLVPVCLSASHTAFGSIRMEPVFMILGESAATAAILSIKNKSSVQDLPFELLRAELEADGQILEKK
ncbi:xanthan lyase [Jiulongibacter sediminis]|uniref:Xanthan lyase n=1 Tax=Jiulongibacter sediminis TaxID=1605367 RepID=A0A0N8H9R5_9BACT|nr:xanthan lyase [Jiulongibacter sediminis]